MGLVILLANSEEGGLEGKALQKILFLAAVLSASLANHK